MLGRVIVGFTYLGITMKKQLILFISCSLSLAGPLFAADGSWTNTAVDGFWTNSANWSGGIPGSGEKATFSGSGNGQTLIDLSSASTVTVKNVNISSINAASYTFGTGAAGSQLLALDNGASFRVFEGVTNDQTVNATFVLGGGDVSKTTTFRNDSTPSLLTMNGDVDRLGGTGTMWFNVESTGTTELNGQFLNSSGSAGDIDLVVKGSGIVILNGGNNWDGDARVRNGGTLTVSETGVLTSQGEIDVFDGTLNLNSDQSINKLHIGDTSNGGDATINIAAGKTLELNNTVFYYADSGEANNAVITGGTLELGGVNRTINIADNSLIDGPEMTIESAIVNTNASGQLRDIIKQGAGTIKLDASSYNFDQLNIQRGRVQVTSTDAFGQGGHMLIGNNTFDGELELLFSTDTSSAKQMKVGDPNNTGAAETGGAYILNNGAGKFTHTAGFINASDTTPTVARTLTLGGTNTLDNQINGIQDNNNPTTGGIINFVKKDSGKWILADDSTYTGTTTVEGGTLRINKRVGLYNATTASWTDSNIAVKDGATLELRVGGVGFSSADLDTLLALGGATGGFEDGSAIGIHTGLGNFTYSSVIADPNSGANSLTLRKTGGNTLTLDQNNTFSGGATIHDGKLSIQDSNALGTGTITIQDDGTANSILDMGADGLNLTNNIVIGNTGGFKQILAGVTSGNNSMEVSGDITVNETTSGNFELRANDPGSAVNVLNVSGKITGSGGAGLKKTGWGTIILSGDNDYTGNTIIQDGELQIGDNGTSGDIQGNVSFVGGSGGDALHFARSDTYEFDGTISGDGEVIQKGDGAANGNFAGEILELSGDNSYTGGTEINAETRVRASHNNALGTGNVYLQGQDAGLLLADGISIANNLVMDNISSRNHVEAEGDATYSGDIAIDNDNEWNFHLRAADNKTLTVSGDISDDTGGAGGLVISRPGTTGGTVILSGSNTYSGVTRISAGGGVLQIDGDSSGATGDVEIDFGTLSGSGTIGGAVSINAGGFLEGTLTFDAGVTVAGNLNPGNSPGTMTFNSDLTIEDSATLTLELDGTAQNLYDIIVNGDANDTITFEDGATIAFEVGYSAQYGDSFEVLQDWNSYAGTLGNLNITGTDLGGGLSLDTSSLLTDGTVNVIPEPAVLSLVLLFGGGILFLKRRFTK